MSDNYYISQTLYNNIRTIAKEHNQTITDIITIYITYAIEHNIKWKPDSVTVPDKVNHISSVHFTPRFTSKKLYKILLNYNLDNSQLIQAIQYRYATHRKGVTYYHVKTNTSYFTR